MGVDGKCNCFLIGFVPLEIEACSHSTWVVGMGNLQDLSGFGFHGYLHWEILVRVAVCIMEPFCLWACGSLQKERIQKKGKYGDFLWEEPQILWGCKMN